MTNLEGALREIREALDYSFGFMDRIRCSDESLDLMINARAKLNAILDAVPKALHDDKLRKGDYWVYECLHLLGDITKEKNDAND